jgi:hypothetical protein
MIVLAPGVELRGHDMAAGAAAVAAAGAVQHVIELAAPALVAWMEARLRHNQAESIVGSAAAHMQAPWKASHMATRHSMHEAYMQQLEQPGVVGMQAFFRWVNKEQLAGEITFEVKQDTAARYPRVNTGHD